MYLQKVISKNTSQKNLYFVDILSAIDERSRIRNRIWTLKSVVGPSVRIRSNMLRIRKTGVFALFISLGTKFQALLYLWRNSCSHSILLCTQVPVTWNKRSVECGTRVSFDWSYFKRFTLKFSKESVQTPSFEMPNIALRILLLLFEINHCFLITV